MPIEKRRCGNRVKTEKLTGGDGNMTYTKRERTSHCCPPETSHAESGRKNTVKSISDKKKKDKRLFSGGHSANLPLFELDFRGVVKLARLGLGSPEPSPQRRQGRGRGVQPPCRHAVDQHDGDALEVLEEALGGGLAGESAGNTMLLSLVPRRSSNAQPQELHFLLPHHLLRRLPHALPGRPP